MELPKKKLVPKKPKLTEYKANPELQELINLFRKYVDELINDNVDKINKENPPKNDGRPKPTIKNSTIRGVNKKYAKCGSKLVKRIQK